jgi:hypothetical protein
MASVVSLDMDGNGGADDNVVDHPSSSNRHDAGNLDQNSIFEISRGGLLGRLTALLESNIITDVDMEE